MSRRPVQVHCQGEGQAHFQLISAAAKGDLDGARALVAEGVDVNHADCAIVIGLKYTYPCAHPPQMVSRASQGFVATPRMDAQTDGTTVAT